MKNTFGLRFRMAAIAATMLAASLFASPLANASSTTSPPTTQAITQSVFLSSNPQASYAALDSTQKTAFDNAYANQTAVLSIVNGTAGPAGAISVAPGTQQVTVNASVSGCWYAYMYYDWYDLGIHTGATWMQLNWCSIASRISSYSISNTGGAGYGGNSYYGVFAKGYLNVGWEVRAYTEYHFGFLGVSAYPCLQIRGGATGLYSTRTTCNLS